MDENKLMSSNFEDPHNRFLSFEEEKALDAYTDKKNKKVPTYKIEAPVYDTITEDGKTLKKKTDKTEIVDKKKSKWLTMSGELKYVLIYWLSRFTREIEMFYESRDKTLPEESEVVSEFVDFCQNPDDMIACITPYIMVVTDKINVSSVMPVVFEDLDSYLHKTFATIFKSNNGDFNKQLGILVDRWIAFMKIVSISFARILWHSKRKGDEVLFFTILRNLSLVSAGDAELEETTFNQMIDYISECKRLLEDGKIKKKKVKDVVNTHPPAETTTEDEFSSAMDDAAEDFSIEDATSNYMAEDDWAEDPFADDGEF